MMFQFKSLLGVLLLVFNAKAASLSNPASENCIKQGGKLTIKKRGDGGEIGVCSFEDNRQCEEWALYRGNCPKGGLKVTGYITPQARYCAITGGEYTVLKPETKDNCEVGQCKLPNDHICDALAYYQGHCS